MIIEPTEDPRSRSITQLARGRVVAYRGVQDTGSSDDDWAGGVTAATQAARENLILTTGRIGGVQYEPTRASTIRQLRLLEARQRNIRSEDGVRSEIRALGRGELLRPGNIVAFGTTMDAAEPCPIISDEWHLLDDVPPHESAVLDLDLQSGGSGVVAPVERPPLLRPGTAFSGSQCSNRLGDSTDDWTVTVRIEECDWATGYICGSMTADNVPKINSPVSTFFEGSIVGVGPHTFVTGDWHADKATDWSHWHKFAAFQRMQQHLARAAHPEEGSGSEEAAALVAAMAAAAAEDVVFMRWKEQSFETKEGATCGLTIHGFYYLCMSCATGEIDGFYYDSTAQPFQKLKLRAARVSHHGFSSSAYQFH